MTKSASSLLISDIELNVFLGWPENERQEKQLVHLDMEIYFDNIPKACLTDQLDDTLCYATLITIIQKKIMDQPFRLIEHLSHEIYQTAKPLLPQSSRIIVRIKKHPKIEGLAGYVCFSYWDDE